LILNVDILRKKSLFQAHNFRYKILLTTYGLRLSLTIPNWITLSRLLAIPLLLYYLQHPSGENRWLSLGIFLVAAMTDWVDGYLARKLNSITELGKFLDPLVDKLLVLAPMLALIELKQLPAWGVFLILARELSVAGWRVTPSLTGSTAIAGANLWGKLKTVSQIIAIALLIAPLPTSWHIPALIAFWVCVALTLVSGAIYLFPQAGKQELQELQGEQGKL
jgi:CDP-diacylglycerol--glycerol-3-phosphate 3-phosphatidyltransferase